MEQLYPNQPEAWSMTDDLREVLVRQQGEQLRAHIFDVYRMALEQRVPAQLRGDPYVQQFAERRLTAAYTEGSLLATLHPSFYVGKYYVQLDRVHPATLLPVAGQQVESRKGVGMFQAFTNITVGYWNAGMTMRRQPMNGFTKPQAALLLRHAIELAGHRDELPSYWQ